MVSTQLLHATPRRAFRCLAPSAVFACSAGATLAADPYAADNGDYPDAARAPAENVTQRLPRQPISVQTAPAYLATLKAYVEPALRKMIEDPSRWDPAASGWYDMVWQASGSNASGGRESILGAFSGQVILKDTLVRSGPTVDMQNHTVIYCDATAGSGRFVQKLPPRAH
jgi:hypothetical protein